MTYLQRKQASEQYREQQKRERERERLTRFICQPCKEAGRAKSTHPGTQHQSGICDCPCR
jgi:hypothetical protein